MKVSGRVISRVARSRVARIHSIKYGPIFFLYFQEARIYTIKYGPIFSFIFQNEIDFIEILFMLYFQDFRCTIRLSVGFGHCQIMKWSSFLVSEWPNLLVSSVKVKIVLELNRRKWQGGNIIMASWCHHKCLLFGILYSPHYVKMLHCRYFLLQIQVRSLIN